MSGETFEEKCAHVSKLLPHKLDKMKEVKMVVPDNGMALIKELVKVIPEMEIVEVKDVESTDEFQRKSPMERFDFAIKAIVAEKSVIANRYDFAWIYSAVQEGSLKGIRMFNSVKSFRQYLLDKGIENVPSNSTISDKYVLQNKPFPDWKFSDCDVTETQRRINIVRRLLCLYNKGK